MAGLNGLGHGGKLVGWVNPVDGYTYDGPSIPVKLTIKWLATVSEIANKWMGEHGLCFSPCIEAKIKDVPAAEAVLDSDMWPKSIREGDGMGGSYRGEGTKPYSEIEPWGDERNRKVGGDFIIYVNSAELLEIASIASYSLELWESYGADDHLLSVDDGYDWHWDNIPGNRMLYYSTLRSLKTAVKRLGRLTARLEDRFYAKA